MDEEFTIWVIMSAFLIVEIKEIHDKKTYNTYRSVVPANLAAAGGTYLVRSGELEVLEGDWRPRRLVVIRFESAEAARGWWSSSEHADLKEMRHRSTTANLILVEGATEI